MSGALPEHADRAMNTPENAPRPDLRTVAAAIAARVETAMRGDLATALAGGDPDVVRGTPRERPGMDRQREL